MHSFDQLENLKVSSGWHTLFSSLYTVYLRIMTSIIFKVVKKGA